MEISDMKDIHTVEEFRQRVKEDISQRLKNGETYADIAKAYREELERLLQKRGETYAEWVAKAYRDEIESLSQKPKNEK